MNKAKVSRVLRGDPLAFVLFLFFSAAAAGVGWWLIESWDRPAAVVGVALFGMCAGCAVASLGGWLRSRSVW
jgi:hypothetical protein